jgi:hypothetical protein
MTISQSDGTQSVPFHDHAQLQKKISKDARPVDCRIKNGGDPHHIWRTGRVLCCQETDPDGEDKEFLRPFISSRTNNKATFAAKLTPIARYYNGETPCTCDNFLSYHQPTAQRCFVKTNPNVMSLWGDGAHLHPD